MPTTPTNQTKHSASPSGQSKNSALISNEARSLSGSTVASAGQAIGFLLAFTYSGGQILVPGSLPVITNLTRS